MSDSNFQTRHWSLNIVFFLVSWTGFSHGMRWTPCSAPVECQCWRGRPRTTRTPWKLAGANSSATRPPSFRERNRLHALMNSFETTLRRSTAIVAATWQYLASPFQFQAHDRPNFIIEGGLWLERHPVQLAIRSVEIGRVKEERPHSSTLRGGTFGGRAGARFHCWDTQVKWIWCTGPGPAPPPPPSSSCNMIQGDRPAELVFFFRQCAKLKFQSHGVIRIDPTSYWIAKAIHARFQW